MPLEINSSSSSLVEAFLNTFELKPSEMEADLVSQNVQSATKKVFTQFIDKEGCRTEVHYKRFWFYRNVLELTKNGKLEGYVKAQLTLLKPRYAFYNSEGKQELNLTASITGYYVDATQDDLTNKYVGHFKFHKNSQALKLLDEDQKPIFTTTYKNGAWITQIQQNDVLTDTQIKALISTYHRDKNMGYLEAYGANTATVALLFILGLATSQS